MKFYAIHEGITDSISKRIQNFKNACKKKSIEFCPVNSSTFDYSNIQKLSKTDLLYNIGRGSEVLESLLLNDDVTTFYIQNPKFISNQTDTTKYSIIHNKTDIPVPKTIFQISTDRELLKNYVDNLGGFPLIIKATGSTRGIGTIKIESWQNLISTVDYLMTTGDQFILREFIKNDGAARIIVLGNKVIASEFRDNLKNDFRVSGSKEKNYYQKDFDDKTYKIAIEATRIANLETSGVDIIFDKNNNPYLLEINTPFDFVPTQEVTNVDIAHLMVDYLINKQR